MLQKCLTTTIIDIALPISEVENAKEILQDALGDKYDIQDYATDEYYSPRLSNFRIREKQTISEVSEKDSPLSKKYISRGLFIDVYAYSPLLVNKLVDSWYRRLMIHPLNKKIKNCELQMIHGRSTRKRSKAERKYFNLRRLYQKRVDRHTKHANNFDYVAYTPNYIDNLKKAGPYIQGSYMIGERKKHRFVDGDFYIPNNPIGVLEACYGESWECSPHKSMEELKKEYRCKWYSENTFNVSSLKHLKYVNIKNEQKL